MSRTNETFDLRFYIIGGGICIALSALAFALHRPTLASITGLIGVGYVIRAYYEGASLLLTSPEYGRHAWLHVLVIALPWLLGFAFFARDASIAQAIARFRLASTGVLVGAGFTLLFFGYYSRVLSSSSRPRARAYLWAILVVAGLSFKARENISFGSSDEDSTPAEDSSGPREDRNRALLLFVLYTGACAVGISLPRNAAANT
jgi:hypothetical protein